MTPEDRMKVLGSSDASTPTEAEWLRFKTTAHGSLRRRRLAVVAAGAAVIVAVTGGTFAATRFTPEPAPDLVAPPDPTRSPTPGPVDRVDRRLPMPLNQWFIERDGKLTPFTYFLYRPVSPRRLLAQTIDFVPGPLGETGGQTAIPDDARLADLSFEDGTAYVAIDGEAPANEADRRMAHAQIVYTATQFRGIEAASISWGSDQGRLESREDFHDLLPPIAIERPFAVQEVYRFIPLQGIANVYEATVSWRLTDEQGNEFQQGFVTATCGNGCWGTFHDKIELYRVPGKRIVLEVFETSAEDGSPKNMIRIPLEVQLN